MTVMRKFLSQMTNHHKRKYEELASLGDERLRTLVGKQGMTATDVVDLLWYERETCRVLDDLRREIQKSYDDVERSLCAWMVLRNEPMTKLAGRVATAYPRVQMEATLPKKSEDPGGYYSLMRWLGIPEDKIDSGVIRVHWPRFCETLTALASSGEPLPPGLSPDKVYSRHRLTLTERKEKNDDCEK